MQQFYGIIQLKIIYLRQLTTRLRLSMVVSKAAFSLFFCIPFVAGAQNSDIIDVSTYATGAPEFNTNIPYINFIDGTLSSNGTIIAMKIQVRDGGVSLNDADALPTIIQGMKFSIQDDLGNNRATFIKKAVLCSPTGTPLGIAFNSGTDLTFLGLYAPDFTANDGATLELHLRVSFDETQVIDNTKLIFTVTDVTTDPTGSAMAAANGGGAFSDNSAANNRNRIEVSATGFYFSVQPTDTQVGLAMTPVTVDAVDAYGRKDVDYTTPIVITSTGSLSAGSITATPVAGSAQYNTIVHNAGATGIVLQAVRSGTNDWLTYSVTFDITTFAYAAGDYRPSIDYTDFATDGDWEIFNGTVWVAGQTAPQNLPVGTRPNRIYIDKFGITAGSSFSNSYKTITVLDGGELFVIDDDPSPATINPSQNFISANNELEIKSGGAFYVQGDVQLANNAKITLRSGATMVLDQSTLTNSHPFWNGTENFEANSLVVLYDWNFTASATSASLINNTTSISNNTGGYKFGILLINTNTNSDFILSTSSSTINFTQNELLVLNGGTGFTSCTSNAGTGGLLMNGSLEVFDGNFSFSSSNNASSYNHQNTVNGPFTCQSDDALLIHRNKTGTPASLNGGTVSLKGDVFVGSTVTSFTNQAASDNTRVGVSFIGGNSVADPMFVNIAPVATAISMNVKSGSFMALSQNSLQLNSIASNTAIFTVESNATLDFNFGIDEITPLTIQRITSGGAGTNQFATQSGSTLIITSPNGIQQANASLGNVQLNNADKSYNQQATFWYKGRADQVTGDAISNTTTGKQIIVDLINNALSLTLSSSFGISSSTAISPTGGKLEIRKGKLLETAIANITAGSTGTLYMADSTLYRINSSSASGTDLIPRMDGSGFAYNLTGASTIELGALGVQTLRGGKSYRNISFSGSGIKTLSASTPSITGTVTMNDAVVVDADVNVLGGAGTNLVMNGTSYYAMKGGNIKPDALGLYTLNTGTTVEFANSGGSAQFIRLTPTYYKIVVTGTNVGNSSTATGIKLGDFGGSFTVKTGARFFLLNSTGFSGSFLTAVSSLNNPAIILEDGSTIAYAGANQLISNQVISSPAGSNYVNLELNGSNTKTAPGEFDPPLLIKGNLTNANAVAFAHNRGTIVFNGTATQTYTATPAFRFFNLTNSNTSSGALVLGSNLAIENVLTLSAAAKLNVSNSRVSLLSTATSTARVAPVGAGASVSYGSGFFVVQRYVPAKRAWRLLSVPIDPAAGTRTISEAWQEGQTNYATDTTTASFATQITGGTVANGFDQSSTNNSSIKYFNAGNWITPPNTNSTAVKSQEGWMVFVRGDRTNYGQITTQSKPPTNTTLRPRGALFIGNKTITSTGFTVVGNPYASGVDYSTITKTGALAGTDTYYMWDPQLGGTFGVGGFVTLTGTGGNYISTPPSNIDEYFIPSGAAFMVNFGAGGSLTFKETDKATLQTTTAFKPSNLLQTVLHTVDADGSTYITDGTTVLFDDNANNDVDQADAVKPANFAENFGLRRGNSILSVEKRKPATVADTIFFNTGQVRLKNYRLAFKTPGMNAANLTAFLEDAYLKKSSQVPLGDTSTVDFSINNQTGSYATDRFRIVFKQLVSFNHLEGTLSGQDVVLNWSVLQHQNILNYAIERSVNGKDFSSIATVGATGLPEITSSYSGIDRSLTPGVYYYRIKAIGLVGSFAYSNSVKITVIRVANQPFIYPNPVVNQLVTVQMNGMPSGEYAITILSTGGQAIVTKQVRYQSGSNTISISLPVTLAKGHYLLEMFTPDKTKQTIPFVH